MNEKYAKIIDLPRPTSERHEPMARSDRAAQFAPYSALSGYEDAVEETARLTDSRIELDEYEKEKINERLTALLSAPLGTRVSVTYFRPDKRKSGGAYVTLTGEIDKYDEARKEISLIGSHPIGIDEIIEICKTDT